MQSANTKINRLLESLDEEDYDKAVSYIEFLIEVSNRNKTKKEKTVKNPAEVEEIVDFLTGAIPDTGKTLEEYRSERLRKYEIPD